MQWNLPHMPWDETSIEVVKFDVNDDGKTKRLNDRIVELSMKNVNFHAPQWSPQSQLHLICDRTNWWNVYSVDLEQKQLNENVYETQSEIGAPQWQFCDRHYAMNQHGSRFVLF
ncbi:unnamed protein product [Anisakis simplex]|uniref:Dipeptidyl peptidase family member 6 (inferred by orthology to a C. elegans protein) n=1 Tax=Anisakis simplex TaxID=6269 RepID=A0A0M3JAV0_ANISI|nr:unnamed protein product [Anisakis simplex]